MTSQLNVDTIVDKAGTGGSNVKMANTSTYVDGTKTQNVSSSVIKHWTIIDQSGTTESLGSFNQSSLTDVDVGRTQLHWANNFASASAQCITAYNAYSVDGSWYQLVSTSSYRLTSYMEGSSAYYDVDHCSGQITGDLA